VKGKGRAYICIFNGKGRGQRSSKGDLHLTNTGAYSMKSDALSMKSGAFSLGTDKYSMGTSPKVKARVELDHVNDLQIQ
jgi:hypothetical protein